MQETHTACVSWALQSNFVNWCWQENEDGTCLTLPMMTHSVSGRYVSVLSISIQGK
jgi:hypothetical protein